MAKPKAAVQVEGLRALRRDLRRLGDDAVDELKDVHDRTAKMVFEAALPRVPVRTGRLKQSVRYSGTRTGGTVRAGYKRVPYAGPVHFGWRDRGIKPQPFFYEALDRRESAVVATFLFYVKRLQRKHGL